MKSTPVLILCLLATMAVAMDTTGDPDDGDKDKAEPEVTTEMAGTTEEAEEALDPKDFVIYWVARSLWVYVAPFILLFGTVGNIITAIVIRKSRLLWQRTTSLYILCLALLDIYTLNHFMIRSIIWVWKIRLDTFNNITCGISMFMYYFMQYMEIWVLVNMSLERLVAVYFPLQAKTWLTKKRAAIVLALNALVLIGVNVIWFWETSLTDYGTFKNCDQMVGKPHLYNDFLFVDFAFASIGPCAIMVLCAVAIALKIVYTNKSRSKMSVGSEIKVSSMTVTMLAMALGFFICTAPISFIYMVWKIAPLSPSMRIVVSQLGVILRLLAYMNFAWNFLIYCMSNPKFRIELMFIICKKPRPTKAKSSFGTTSTTVGSTTQTTAAPADVKVAVVNGAEKSAEPAT